MGDWAGDPHTGWAAQLHRDLCTPDRPRRKRKVVCKVCGATMNRKNLKKHMERKHG